MNLNRCEMGIMKKLLMPLVFVAVVLCILLFEQQHILLETSELTPFYTTYIFTCDVIFKVGGCLEYMALLLQSLFAEPCLGAILLCFVLMALAYVLKWSFRVDGCFEPLCWIPSMFFLLNYTQLGYLVLELASSGVAFVAPLGTLFAVLLIGVWMRIGTFGRYVWVFLVVSAGYYMIGVYSVLAVGGVLLFSVVNERSVRSWCLVVLLIVLMFIVPHVLWNMGLLEMRHDALFEVGVPAFLRDGTESMFYAPLICALSTVAIVMLTCVLPRKTWMWWVCMLLFLGVSAYGWRRAGRNEQLCSLLTMKHAIEDGDYATVIEEARNYGKEPTRLHVLLTRLALTNYGCMGDSLFYFPDGNAPYESPRLRNYMTMLGSGILFYHNGVPNYSTRWCMEGIVNFGCCPTYLKYMTKSALVNGETKLAKKYLNLLNNTLTHVPFAEKYMPYVCDSTLVDKDDEMRRVRLLMNYESILDNDGGSIEDFLLYNMAFLNGGDESMEEMLMINALLQKKVQDFGRMVINYVKKHENERLPVHYQEGLVLVAHQLGVLDRMSLPIDSGMKERFGRFNKVITEKGKTGTAKYLLTNEFGRTYWFYYYYGGMKSRVRFDSNVQER